MKEFPPPKPVQGPNRKNMRRSAQVCAISTSFGVYKTHNDLCWCILAGAALPCKTEVGSFGMSICHAPTDPTQSFLELPRQCCLAVNYSSLLLISCLQPVTAWEPLPLSFVPQPSQLPLPSSQPEHFILVTVPEARPLRTFEIKHSMKYSAEKREEKGAISAPQACKSRAFVMPLKVFYFQLDTNHVLGCPREPLSMMEISTLALFSFLLFIVA